MPAYKPGQVSAALSSKKKKKTTAEDSVLSDLFSSTKLPPPLEISDSQSIVPKKRSAKPSTKDEPTTKKKKSVDSSEPFPFQHESLQQKQAEIKKKEKSERKKKIARKVEDELAEKRPRRNRKREKTADKRTIFVGNCPLSADKKVLKRLFKEYGEIETMRFRCAPAADPELPRRAIVITKNFNEKCKSYVSYIVFKEEESAKKALEKNNFVLDGLHLRVDSAAGGNKGDKKRSVFIGNLPFDVQEDELRKHFEDCGDIINVRVVRDRQTSLGKGIAFVQFESKDSVSLAQKLNNSNFQGRTIRVMGCSNKAKLKEAKKVKEDKKDKDKKPGPTEDKKKISFAPSNAPTSKFKALLKTKKEKRLKKKQKKASGKKTDQITAILGEAPTLPSKMKAMNKKADKTAVKGKKTFKKKGDFGKTKRREPKRNGKPGNKQRKKM